MAGTLISKIVNGEDNSTSFTNLQQSMLMLMRSHDGMTFGNFVKGNTAMLNVLAQSSVSVNYNVYKWTVAETILFLAANGSTSSMDSAVAAEYLLIAVVNAESQCAIYARIASEITVVGSELYGGWYVSGTQHRVLGGFTKTSEGTYERKWRYQISRDFANEAGEYNYRAFADGIELSSIINHDHVSVYSTTAQVQHDTTPVTLFTVNLKATARLVVEINSQSYGTTNGKTARPSYSLSLVALSQNGDEIDAVASKSATVDSGIASGRLALFNLFPGNYKMVFHPTNTVASGGNLRIQTNSMVAYLTDIFGVPKGTY